MALLFDTDFNAWESLDNDVLGLTTSDFWEQVQFETLSAPSPPSTESLISSEEDWQVLDSPPIVKLEDIVNQDCMWAAQCDDEDLVNPGTFVNPSNIFVSSDPLTGPTTPGQSLLRRDISPSRPDTPISIDGDVPQFRHTVDVASTARRLLRDSAVVAADHSYTARRKLDSLGVQTPSDSCESEEEIDVVSVGTQQTILPTQIQSQTVSHVPSTTEHQYIQPNVEATIVPRPTRPIARKRLVPPPNITAKTRRRGRGPGRRSRRSHTDSDSEAESPELERRSLHNDMERQRRIGLKNLFDELKMEIPATRDKERAPKVVILREAAALCRNLCQYDIDWHRMKKKQDQLRAKITKLRKSLSHQRVCPY